MDNTWLVIANDAKAYIYDLEHPTKPEIKDLPLIFRDKHDIPLIKTFEHPEGRMLAHEFMSDKDGHLKSPGTHGKFSEDSTPHEKEEERFAEEIAKYLEHARGTQSYQHLIICAAPHFYGLLKQRLHAHAAAMIQEHLLKDYVPLQKESLRKVIEGIEREYVK